MIQEIKKLLILLKGNVHHTYREVNSTADVLANQDEEAIFSSVHCLSKNVEGSSHSDSIGMPSLMKCK